MLERQVERAGGLNTEALLERLGFHVHRREIRYLGLVFGEDDATIADVLDDSPAGRSGLAPGDVITHVNGFTLTRAALRWAATHPDAVTLTVTRGHRVLSFTLQPGERETIDKLVWRGDGNQQRRLFTWFGREFPMTDGQEIPLTFYENFHGVDTVL